MDAERVAEILKDKSFCELVDQMSARLTKKVMASSTSLEEREKLVTEYHALQAIIAQMRSVTQGA